MQPTNFLKLKYEPRTASTHEMILKSIVFSVTSTTFVLPRKRWCSGLAASFGCKCMASFWSPRQPTSACISPQRVSRTLFIGYMQTAHEKMSFFSSRFRKHAVLLHSNFLMLELDCVSLLIICDEKKNRRLFPIVFKIPRILLFYEKVTRNF